ncbi:unnamed protein product [Calypogeia fissa]
MAKLMAALVVLLALQTPMLAVARLQVENPFGDMKSAEGNLDRGLAMELMHYHHVKSPYGRHNLSLPERVEIAVKSSQGRAQFFHNQIYGVSSSGDRFPPDLPFSDPVFSAQGGYIMQLTIGTPSRTFAAIVDTGSDLVWVQCAPCTSCFQQPDPIFDPTTSSSYTPQSCIDNALCSALPPPPRGLADPCTSQLLTCQYLYPYGDGSFTAGDLASETVTLTGTTGTRRSFPGVGFGCGHKNEGTFPPVIDGLVGLGQGPLSLVVQLGPQIGHLFSYCLVDFHSATTKTSLMLLGATGGLRLTYTPLAINDANPTFYYVTLVGITVDGVAVDYPSVAFAINANGEGGMILDSGTTITQMDSQAYTPFRNQIAVLIAYPTIDLSASQPFDLCYNLTGVPNPKFPSVVFQFTNLNLTLPSKNIFLQVDEVPNYCLAFLSSNGGISIFGNIQQQNFQITFDTANKRVGFAPTTC